MSDQDERIFTDNSMFDFALRIAQDAMSAAFEGSKLINDKLLEDHIRAELEDEPGV